MEKPELFNSFNIINIAGSVFLVLFLNLELAAAGEKQVSGWIENVSVGESAVVFRAKIDTGAKHSSLHAGDYELYDKQGVEWVKFSLKNIQGDLLQVDRPVKRVTQIKQKGNRPNRKRPVIELGICMGNIYKVVEVNLADRANFNYPMLVGRSYLQGSYVVDSDQKFLLEPRCRK